MNPPTKTAGLQRPKATTEEKVLYDSGYGDFCFGRRRDVLLHLLPRSLDLEYERTGTFNLFGLPPEVRLRIYHFFLEPIYQYCEDTKRNYIEIQLQTSHWGPSWGIERLRNNTPHPGRRSDYILKLVREGQPKFKINSETWKIVQQIRHLSNTSCKLRQEFGTEFWRNVHLKCQTMEQIAALPSFLQDRPAAHAGIKILSLQFRLYTWHHALVSQPQVRIVTKKSTGTVSFGSVMDNASKLLRLESLSLTFQIEAESFEHLGWYEQDWLHTIRSLNVSKGFDLKFTEMEEFFFPFSLSIRSWDQLERKWSPVIRNLIMPDTLRGDLESQPLNEVEQYMQSRLL